MGIPGGGAKVYILRLRMVVPYSSQSPCSRVVQDPLGDGVAEAITQCGEVRDVQSRVAGKGTRHASREIYGHQGRHAPRRWPTRRARAALCMRGEDGPEMGGNICPRQRKFFGCDV